MNTTYRVGIYAFMCLNLTLCGGLVYGWPSMAFLLQKGGVYSDGCLSVVDQCPARSTKLVETYATAFLGTTLGYFAATAANRNLGSKAGNLIAFSLVVLSLITVSVTLESQMDGPAVYSTSHYEGYYRQLKAFLVTVWGYIPLDLIFDPLRAGFFLMGLAGTMLLGTSTHIVALFPKYQKLMLSFLTMSFAFSSLIFSFFRNLSDKFELRLDDLFLLYCIVPISSAILVWIFIPNVSFNGYISDTMELDNEATVVSPVVEKGPKEEGSIIPLGLFSLRYFCSCLTSASNLLICNFWLATFQDITNGMGDNGAVLSRGTAILPFCPLAAPLFGVFMEHYGLGTSTLVVNGFIFGLSVMPQINSLPIQLLGAVFYGMGRPMNSALSYAYIREATGGLDNLPVGIAFSSLFTGTITKTLAPIIQEYASKHSLGAAFGILSCMSVCSYAILLHDRIIKDKLKVA